ncbi:uncharacterized protein LOC114537851 [Dendronephthya gigantea]|uniref:uncharacterized protein LOC114537851 n=1 Tax=Dendronephthya gigantea TaxID=151771 RepID=UPI00106CDB67|nr:uncharacterized protein LOC114537851 [Dendronephthya gigantea]
MGVIETGQNATCMVTLILICLGYLYPCTYLFSKPIYHSTQGCALNNLTENHKRWCAYGIALNHVLITAIRPVLDKEILKEYNDLVSSCGIDVQTKHNFPTSKYPTSMNYKNINGNDKKPFDYKVTSHIDFSKLFLKDFMAKLSAFDETCDASAVLTLLERIPIFPADVQNAAKDVRVDRNAWGHCNFTEWNDSKFRKRFDCMEKLVGEVDPADKSKVVADLNDWKERGVILCMNATIDPELAKMILERVSKLSSDVEEMAVESKEEIDNLRKLDNAIKNIEKRFEKMEQKFEELQLKTAEKRQNYDGSGENTTVAFIPTRLRKDLRELLDIEIVGIENYQMLADRLGYGMQFIRWLGSLKIQSPTDTLLAQWENDQGSRSPRDALRHLQETLSKMKRQDAVDKIQEYFDELLIGKETIV